MALVTATEKHTGNRREVRVLAQPGWTDDEWAEVVTNLGIADLSCDEFHYNTLPSGTEQWVMVYPKDNA